MDWVLSLDDEAMPMEVDPPVEKPDADPLAEKLDTDPPAEKPESDPPARKSKTPTEETPLKEQPSGTSAGVVGFQVDQKVMRIHTYT